MRKAVQKAYKIMVAAILAFLIATGFCCFYCNVPPAVPCESGATDYTYPGNTLRSAFTEGHGWGINNNEGYNDLIDYTPGMDIDILIMGASHMEAYQVNTRQSTASCLQEKLPEKCVYNIGITGHDFLTCAANLAAAIDNYHPKEYVVIDTGTVTFSEEDLQTALAGTIKDHFAQGSKTRSSLYEKYPLLITLRLVPRFLISNLRKLVAGPEDTAAADAGPMPENKEKLLDEVLANIHDTAQAAGTKVLIVYHPGIELQADGTIRMEKERAEADKFAALCEKNNIEFLDVSTRFQAEYEANKVLPYGFSNSSVGSGHLNRYGHAMIADEIYKKITGGAA